MVWRTRQQRVPSRPGSALAELVVQLETGSATAETRLHTLFDAADQETSDSILDALASSAADGSPYSLELLLGFVSEKRLAAPVIGRHINSKSVAEEVEQEVLIAVARSIHRYRGDAKFSTWLYALARNTAVTEIRKQRATAAITDENVDHWDQRRVSSLVAERDLLRDAIYSLPPVFRETVLLRDVERLSYSEIAERQGLAINTVRSRLSRGRSLLAALIPAEQRST